MLVLSIDLSGIQNFLKKSLANGYSLHAHEEPAKHGCYVTLLFVQIISGVIITYHPVNIPNVKLLMKLISGESFHTVWRNQLVWECYADSFSKLIVLITYLPGTKNSTI